MIPNVKDRELHNNGVSDIGTFGISIEDSAHIMGLLRDSIYTDKIKAVLREYSSNAWDANRAVGKGDVPIYVHLPTEEDPTLIIRDQGPGLSKEDVFKIYTQYGASTKRSDDESVGMLGIGSKSGFAYSDTFSVTSWHNGRKMHFVAVLDVTEKGLMNLLHETPCGKTTGVEIKIAVKQEDIEDFRDKAVELFRFFEPRPEINVDLPEPQDMKAVLQSSNNGYIFSRNYFKGGRFGNTPTWVAVMGCVPYRIDIDQILPKSLKDQGHWNNLSGVLYFKIGELNIAASREELKYSEQTKKVVLERITTLVDEYIQTVLSELASNSTSPWDRRLRARDVKYLDFPFPDDLKQLFSGSVTIQTPPKTFIFKQIGRKKTYGINIPVIKETRLIIRDTNKTLSGYGLRGSDFIVRKKGRVKMSEVMTELDDLTHKFDIVGIPTLRMSNMQWSPSISTIGRRSVIPNAVKVFKFIPEYVTYNNRARAWEPAPNKVISPDDVYVVVNKFIVDIDGFQNMYQRDKKLLGLVNEEIPDIYAYRNTEKNPLDQDKLIGKDYRDWRQEKWQSLIWKYPEAYENWLWATMFDYHDQRSTIYFLKPLLSNLGRDHQITKAFVRHLKERKKLKAIDKRLGDGLKDVFRMMEDIGEQDEDGEKLEPRILKQALKEKYPLLHVGNGYYADLLGELFSGRAKDWFDYIKMVDYFLEGKKP